MSSFRSLLLDMERTGQIIGLMLRNESGMKDVTVARVGSDYAMFLLIDPLPGCAVRQPCHPFSEIVGIDVRPCFYDPPTDEEADDDHMALLADHLRRDEDPPAMCGV